jgi:hypothetical protein
MSVIIVGAEVPNLDLTLGHHALCIRSRAGARGRGGEEGREVSLASHVPGMKATGKSQVAVKMIPWPAKNEKRFLKELAISHTSIEGLHRTPAPGNETSDVLFILDAALPRD